MRLHSSDFSLHYHSLSATRNWYPLYQILRESLGMFRRRLSRIPKGFFTAFDLGFRKVGCVPALSDGNIKAVLSQVGSTTNCGLFAGSFQVVWRGRCVKWLSEMGSIAFVLVQPTYQQQIIWTARGHPNRIWRQKCDKLSKLKGRSWFVHTSPANLRILVVSGPMRDKAAERREVT